MTRYFSCNHIPELPEYLTDGVPCPFCKELMDDYNVCTRFSDLIDDDMNVDTFYNFQTLETVKYDPYQ